MATKAKTKGQLAAQEALKTAKMANTLAKALAQRYAHRWRFVDFRGPKGQESAGIVDILAIRKSSKKRDIEGLKSLDLFDIILIQVKGGAAAKPSWSDTARMRIVQGYYRAESVVLFEWRRGKGVTYSVLRDDDSWHKTTVTELFGKPPSPKVGVGKSTKAP